MTAIGLGHGCKIAAADLPHEGGIAATYLNQQRCVADTRLAQNGDVALVILLGMNSVGIAGTNWRASPRGFYRY
jgi:hypothetical protein